MIALGDLSGAQAWLDDPASVEGVILRVLTGQTKDATTLLKATLRTETDPRLWTVLGRVQDTAGDHSAARQAYAMAGLAGARRGLSENNIGQSHWLSGNKAAALDAFTRAVAADPQDMQFDNNRRRALIALGRTAEAVARLDATRAGVFLAKAGDRAAADGETRLAALLYRKSLDLAPRHNPRVAAKLELLQNEARHPVKHAEAETEADQD